MMPGTPAWLSVEEVVRETSARVEGPALRPGTQLSGASTDTRDILPGTLFVALKGDRFDGHDYVGEAFRKGACAALVSFPSKANGPQLVVGDTRLALQGLARAVVRKRMLEGKRLVTLTGTAGKTTTRELLRLVLSEKNVRPHSNRENWNNEIGVPRTLWEWGSTDGDAVLEVGIRKHGDMDYLSSVLLSDAAVITSVGEGHLETLGSVEGVWAEKSRLLAYVRPEGTVVLPLDLLLRFRSDPIFRESRKRFSFVELSGPKTDGARRRPALPLHSSLLEASLREDGKGRWVLSGTQGAERFQWELPSPSVLLATDALLALAAGRALGVPLVEGARRLEGFEPLPGRMQEERTPEGALLLLDHYNANPLSIRGGFQWCVDVWKKEQLRVKTDRPGKLLAILGDMLELGEDAPRLHREIGSLAAACPFSAIYYKGRFFGPFRDGYCQAGGRPEILSFLGEEHPAKRESFPELSLGDVVLLKGSRGMHLEQEAHVLGGTS